MKDSLQLTNPTYPLACRVGTAVVAAAWGVVGLGVVVVVVPLVTGVIVLGVVGAPVVLSLTVVGLVGSVVVCESLLSAGGPASELGLVDSVGFCVVNLGSV